MTFHFTPSLQIVLIYIGIQPAALHAVENAVYASVVIVVLAIDAVISEQTVTTAT